MNVLLEVIWFEVSSHSINTPELIMDYPYFKCSVPNPLRLSVWTPHASPRCYWQLKLTWSSSLRGINLYLFPPNVEDLTINSIITKYPSTYSKLIPSKLLHFFSKLTDTFQISCLEECFCFQTTMYSSIWNGKILKHHATTVQDTCWPEFQTDQLYFLDSPVCPSLQTS